MRSAPMTHSLLRNHDYLRLFTAQVTGLFGTGFTTVALALLAYELAGAAAAAVLGAALTIKMVVYVTVAPGHPDILPDEREYTRALSAAQLAATMETLLSPMLAAVALTVLSFHWLFVGTAMGFAVSAALVITTRIPERDRRDRGFLP